MSLNILQAALQALNGHVWKKKTLSAKVNIIWYFTVKLPNYTTVTDPSPVYHNNNIIIVDYLIFHLYR